MNDNPTSLLDLYIKSRYPVIVILSHEESRVMRAITAVAQGTRQKRTVVEWSYTKGITGLPGISPDETEDPTAALNTIANFDEKGQQEPILFVVKDMHDIIKQDIRVRRYIRDIAAHFEVRKHTLILLSASMDIPSDIEKSVVVLDWPLPDTEELGAILRTAEESLPSEVKVDLGENGRREAVVNALRGLSETETKRVLKAGAVATRELSERVIPYIIKEKAQIIRKSGVLEYYPETVTMSDVGGLELLKEYARVKRAAFSAKARAAGVDAPKGVLMLGPAGTGKSLSAKAIAGGEMPLLRMDIGALMGSLVGQSEANMRSALKVAEAIAPCVLWVDEIEKALGGSGGEMDGGTSTRVLGTLLTWMQENKAPVYVIATANDVRQLRPELLRRFDDIMWIDLPSAASREQILKVHLTKRGHPVKNLEKVVSATWGYSGAEIEKVVKSAVEICFLEDRDVTAQDLLEAARKIVPLSRTMKSSIDELRSWAANRARLAGEPLEAAPDKIGLEYEAAIELA